MAVPKILAFSGSTRQGSYNQHLVTLATEYCQQAGAQVTLITLADYPLPLFSEEIEKNEGTPDAVSRLKSLFKSHQALLIASPEYNSSITPLLKNTLDWVSRAEEGEGPLACYKDKLALLMSASPGALGGLRGMVHLTSILQNIGVTVIPQQVAVGRAYEAYDDNGQLKDANVSKMLRTSCNSLVKVAQHWPGLA